MRVAAFVHLQRTLLSRKPTGVGKHINCVVPGLAQLAGMDLRVLAVREELSATGEIPEDSPLHGLAVTPIPWRRRTVEACWALANWPAVERWTGGVDWVYCPAESYVAARRARLAVTVHSSVCFERGMPWSERPEVRRDRRRLGSRFRRIARGDALVLTVSHFLSGRLADLFGISPERMHVVGNGVEEAYYEAQLVHPPRCAEVTAGRPYVLVVGGLMQWKGADDVLALAIELARRRSQIHVVVAGRNEPAYDAPAARHSNLHGLGYVGVEEGLPALIAGSVAVYVPSLYETFGIPAAEAMAAGAPAVVSRQPALLEVVGDAGLPVDPAKAETVADLIEHLAADRGFRSTCVAAGRERAEQFRWAAVVERVAKALRR